MMNFADENTQNVIASFLRELKKCEPLTNEIKAEIKFVTSVLPFIQKNPELWDEKTVYNRQSIGEHLVDQLANFSESMQSDVSDISSYLYRFLCELEFFIGSNKKLSTELQFIKADIDKIHPSKGEDEHSQYLYARLKMPIELVSSMLNTEGIESFRDFNNKIEEAKTLTKSWEAILSEKERKVAELQAALKEYEVGFNFVGLFQGFEELKKTIIIKQRWHFTGLVVVGILALVPLLSELYFLIFSVENPDFSHLVYLPTIIAIEILLIYFFRVILHSYNSVKLQRLQIELRQTLCQFIQSYAEYSSEIKEKDGVVLEKFENLIFSGILTDSNKLPSTYDGLEQIGKLLDRFKSGSP
ncbi:hypothetical protein [Sneathiella limimaris]|uniref:hypothetical protein n=1 Tax=Sneathiella limimaris TaxID=1964213 RepID=UPI00146F55B5|nr:hypothetical protein [Sneathiella limimaris]